MNQYILLTIFDLFTMLVMTLASGFLVMRLINGTYSVSPEDYTKRFLVGTAVLPFFLVILGYSGYFRLPGGAAVLFVAACCVVGYMLHSIKNTHFYREPIFILLSIIVTLLMATIVYTKWLTLSGNISNGDDLRSLILTSGIAANYMKPAFHNDFSVPLSYSYYLYTLSAYSYLLRGGAGYPTIPVLALTLYAVIVHCLGIRLFMRKVFSRTVSDSLLMTIVVYVVFTYTGLDFLALYLQKHMAFGSWHLEWWNLTQISAIASYFTYTYQYLTAAHLLLAGSILLFIEFEKSDSNYRNVLPGALMIGAGAGYGLFPFVAFAPVILLLIIALICWTTDRKQIFKRLLWASGGLIIIVPLVFCFVGRDSGIVAFVGTPRNWITLASGFESLPDWLRKVVFLPGILVEFGVFALAGLLLTFMPCRNLRYVKLTRILRVVIIVEALLLTFTHSYSFDWYARGPGLILTMAGICGFLIWVGRVFERSHSSPLKLGLFFTVFILMSLPHVYNSLWEFQFQHNRKGVKKSNVDSGAIIRNKLGIHDQIFVAGDGSNWRKLGSLYRLMAVSGRAFIYSVPEGTTRRGIILGGYANKVSFLKKYFKIKTVGDPDNKTWYGSALIGEGYYMLGNNNTFKFVK